MRVATLMLTKPIEWLISAADPPCIPLSRLPGWSIVNPLTPLDPSEPLLRDWPIGDGRLLVSRHTLHSIVPDAIASVGPVDSSAYSELKRLLRMFRHVARQATLPRGDDFGGFWFQDVEELPKVDFGEPYIGEVRFGDESRVDTALTMELVGQAGELPADFEPPVYEGVLLDAFRAVKDNDFRAAIFYSALAVEAVAGTMIEQAHSRLLATTPTPADVRAVRIEEGKSKGELEDPVFHFLRRTGRFPEQLHELPLYVLGRSLKIDLPDVYKQARKLYQTRNSLAHRGEPSKTKNTLSIDLFGAVEAMTCATEVFAWFGARGGWSIPFKRGVVEWLNRTADDRTGR